MRCGTQSCMAGADFRCFWPGQHISLCARCTLWAWQLGEAMGFELIVQWQAEYEEGLRVKRLSRETLEALQ